MVGTTRQRRAALVTDRGLLTLPGLPGLAKQSEHDPRTVSDDGRLLAGVASDNAVQNQAVAWSCR